MNILPVHIGDDKNLTGGNSENARAAAVRECSRKIQPRTVASSEYAPYEFQCHMLTRRLAGVCLSTSRPYDREKKDHRRATNTKGHLTSNAKTGEIKVADTGNVASIVTALFSLTPPRAHSRMWSFTCGAVQVWFNLTPTTRGPPKDVGVVARGRPSKRGPRGCVVASRPIKTMR